jgi:hypothetical protein
MTKYGYSVSCGPWSEIRMILDREKIRFTVNAVCHRPLYRRHRLNRRCFTARIELGWKRHATAVALLTCEQL